MLLKLLFMTYMREIIISDMGPLVDPHKLMISVGMGSANEKRWYFVMLSLIGWAHTQNEPHKPVKCQWMYKGSLSCGIEYINDSMLISALTLRLQQNGRHYTDNIVRYIFLRENVCILILIAFLVCS